MRRTYGDARKQLDRTEFPSTRTEREAKALYERRVKEATRNVTQAAKADLERLRGQVDELDDRYGQLDREAERLRKAMQSGRIEAKKAGDRLDELRAQAEHLDALPNGLKARENKVAAAMDDPTGFLDEMFRRAPSLRKPDWPW